jgi:hypothetical protein
MRIPCCVVAAAIAVLITVHAATADELARLHAQILRNPANSELNLRYAQLAEEQGKLRWALTAYERVIVNDPANAAAQRGLQRIRRKLQPNTTQFTAEIGAAFESNPRYSPTDKRSELQALASLAMRDERTVGDIRWRTNAAVAGWLHQRNSDLNYGHVGATTGPVFDVGSQSTLHLGVGGSAAVFDHRFYYSEAMATAVLEGYLQGAYRALQVRGAYRDYNDFFPSSHGFWGDVTGKFSFPNVVGQGSVIILTPWLRWSDIAGTGFSTTTPILTEVQPGAYVEAGIRLEAYAVICEGVFAGPTLAVAERRYRADFVPGSTDKRRDTIVTPGATLAIPNLFAFQSGLRLDYKYVRDRSTDPTRSFADHVIAATAVTRF